jgi:ornithine cyclodeaminase/alanine dehydrogenase-like protein (mu-crystallin family)
MTSPGPRWLTEADVTSLLDLPAAMAAIEAALVAEASDAACALEKTHVGFGHGHGLHALGGVLERAGVAGTKTWAHTGGGAAPLLVLFDTADGRVLAVIEAFALGQLRTGAVSGIATDRLARSDAAVLAVVGAGRQALAQVAAVVAARPIREVRVFSLHAESRDGLAQGIEDDLGVAAVATNGLDDATSGADVVTLVTRATEPFLYSEHVASGTHINAVGAITLDRAEFDPALLDRCEVVSCDSVSQARALSRELGEHFGSNDAAWERARPLSWLVATAQSRPRHADLTLFKAMGIGLADVALGVACYERAGSEQLGRLLDAPRRVPPLLSARPIGAGSAS